MTDVFPSPYEEFIYTRTYSRYNRDLKRREFFPETVARYRDFFLPMVPPGLKDPFNDAIDEIARLGIVPSMRCLWSAGDALRRENLAGYNCAYVVADNPRVFAEILYVLMNGTGVGFSVERQHINKLPPVPSEVLRAADFADGSSCHIVFADSKRGWADGYRQFINFLYAGTVPTYDLSKIRPKGSVLKTFGGRASGPEPLQELLQFTERLFLSAAGRKLSSIEVHDVICKIANCVVVGGVRRSAGISLSNLSDLRMRHAKDGQFWIEQPQRALANNSAVYEEKPDISIFLDEWAALIKSGNGERGIINREGLHKTASLLGRDPEYDFGVNPCGEIVLRPFQLCNLTEVIVRAEDSLDDLRRKVRLCTLLGTLQSTLTDFHFVRDIWKNNCEEERLLGVSLTGTCDHPVLGHVSEESEYWLREMKEAADSSADACSLELGINRPKAVTCVKPSGTVSQLVNSASGLHTRHSRFYLRRVRVTATDPLSKMLSDAGVPWDPEVGETRDKHSTMVFSFPVAAPESTITREQRSALEQLEYWKMFKTAWCDHNPSVTVSVKEHEWLDVGAWVYRNWDLVGGLSFLPYSGGHYALAPYEEISKDRYLDAVAHMPEIDFTQLSNYESTDETIGSGEMACSGGSCELR